MKSWNFTENGQAIKDNICILAKTFGPDSRSPSCSEAMLIK